MTNFTPEPKNIYAVGYNEHGDTLDDYWYEPIVGWLEDDDIIRPCILNKYCHAEAALYVVAILNHRPQGVNRKPTLPSTEKFFRLLESEVEPFTPDEEAAHGRVMKRLGPISQWLCKSCLCSQAAFEGDTVVCRNCGGTDLQEMRLMS